MSNVLIGIIGVILFIGLALAGALILGDDFQSSSNVTHGAAIMSVVKQTADAANMAALKTGAPVKSNAIAGLVPRFLKTLPVNTTPAGRANATAYRYNVHLSDRIWPDTSSRNFDAKVAMAVIGEDEQAESICQSIIETYGRTSIPTISASNLAAAPEVGCGLASTFYVAYQKL